MTKLLAIVVWVLITGVCAGSILLPPKSAAPGTILEWPHVFHIWVHGDTDWQLSWQPNSADWQYRISESWLPMGVPFHGSATGGGGMEYSISFRYQASWEQHGEALYSFDVELEHGVGLVRRETDARLYLMAVNCSDFCQIHEGETEQMQPGVWLEFDREDELTVRWNGEDIWQQGGITAQESESTTRETIWWEVPETVAMGDELSLCLVADVQGPAEIRIEFPHCLRVHTMQWQGTNGAELLWKQGLLLIQLPAAGQYRVFGPATARLGSHDSQVSVTAFHEGKPVRTMINIIRGWFAQDSVVRLRFPSGATSILLPDGSVRRTDTQGELDLVLSPGFHVLVDLATLAPIFVDLVAGEQRQLLLDPERPAELDDYALLLFSDRMLAASARASENRYWAGWHLQDQKLTIRGDGWWRWRLTADASRWQLHLGQRNQGRVVQHGSWRWLLHPDWTQGQGEYGPLQVRLAWAQGNQWPSFSWTYHGNRMRLTLAEGIWQGLYWRQGWQFGIEGEKHVTEAWLQFPFGRLQYKDDGISLSGTIMEGALEYCLGLSRDSVQLTATAADSEIMLRRQGERWQLGLRAIYGDEPLSSSLTALVSQRDLQAELRHTWRLPIGDGGGRVTTIARIDGNRLQWDWGVDVTWPVFQVGQLSLGWDSSVGLQIHFLGVHVINR